MKDNEIERVDPELASLFETAAGCSPPPGAKDRVRARLRVTIAAGGAATAAAAAHAAAKTSTTLALTKSWLLAGALAVGGALGGLAIHRLRTPADAPVIQPPSVHPAARTVEPRTTAASALGKEHELLARARRALLQKDVPAATAALAEHERSFPRGIMEEERLTLRIVTLAKSGQLAQARALATRFRRQFPGSIQLATIEQAIAGAR